MGDVLLPGDDRATGLSSGAFMGGMGTERQIAGGGQCASEWMRETQGSAPTIAKKKNKKIPGARGQVEEQDAIHARGAYMLERLHDA